MEYGICPQCGNLVVEIGKRLYNGDWEYTQAKRKKAIKLFDENKKNIIGSLSPKRIKYGFRYGKNVEIKNCKGEIFCIRRYAVDFNDTAKVIQTVILN